MWINCYRFDLSSVVGQQRLERDEVVALDDEVAAAGVAAGEIGHVLEEMERDVMVVVDDGVLPDPVQGRHDSCGFYRGLGSLIESG